MFKRNLTKILLTLIILISFVLRLVNIDTNPPSLSWDEVSHGYNALSILKTGHDEWGQVMPLTNFRAYGDYPTTLYMYLLMPVIAIFGLNDLTVRLPSAFFGALMPLLIFYLVKKFTKKDYIALISALLVSLSPWGILLSRQALQATPAIFFLTLGVLVFLTGLEKKIWLTIWGTIFLGISAYGYHNTRIYAPLLLLGMLFIYRKKFFSNIKVLLAIIFCSAVLFTPIFFALTSAEGRARSNWVGILDQGAINKINEGRGRSILPPTLARLAHNKVVYFSKVAIKNYLGYFSPQFLATKGGTHFQFSLQNFGVIIPITLPFFYLGLILLIKSSYKSNKNAQLLLFWLLTSPLPAIITRDPYQVVRVTTMMPAVFLTIAYGLQWFAKLLSTRDRESIIKIIILLSTALCYSSYKYLHNLYVEYPVKYSKSWQYGYKEAISYIKERYENYDKIIITKVYGEPHEFVLFYTQFDSNALQKDSNLVRYQKSDWYWTNSFDKFQFVNDWEVKEKAKTVHKSVVVAGPDSVPENGEVVKTINFLDGTPAFIIVFIP